MTREGMAPFDLDIAKYPVSLTPLEWYVQFAFRRDLYSDVTSSEATGKSEEYIYERLSLIENDPIVTVRDIYSKGFGLRYFSRSIFYFFTGWPTIDDPIRPALVQDLEDLRDLLSIVVSEKYKKILGPGAQPNEIDAEVNKWMLGRSDLPSDEDSQRRINELCDILEDSNELVYVNTQLSNELLDSAFTAYKAGITTKLGGEISREPKISLLEKKKKKTVEKGHKFRTAYAVWVENRVLPYMDYELSAKIKSFKYVQDMLAEVVLAGKNQSVDTLKNTVKPCVEKMKHPFSRLFQELELKARDDYQKRETRRKYAVVREMIDAELDARD
jgi:hypothetical protein